MNNCTKKAKMLDLSEPFIHMTWAPYNYIISITQREAGFNEWFLNSMINIVGIHGAKGSIPFFRYTFSPDPSTSFAFCNIWDACPYINKLTLNRKLINNTVNDITRFFIEMINDGNYIYTYLNHFFVERNISHQTLVYGYDYEKKLFYIADHFDNGKYSTR